MRDKEEVEMSPRGSTRRFVGACSMAVLVGTGWSLFEVVAQRRDPDVALQLPAPLNGLAGARTVVATEVGVVALTWHGLREHDWRGNEVRALIAPTTRPISIARGPSGMLYIGDGSSQVHVLDAAGKRLKSFRVLPMPAAIAALGDGSVVIAGASGGRLLHRFSADGAWVASFGEEKALSKNRARNTYLNRGLVASGPDDSLFYVSETNPQPFAIHFTANGDVLGEFRIEGAAVAVQAAAARRGAQKKPEAAAGITVITSVAADPLTGNLWVAMNGRSDTSLLYEYTPQGRKAREYRLARTPVTPVSALGGVSVSGTHVYLVSNGDVFAVPRQTDGLIAAASPLVGACLPASIRRHASGNSPTTPVYAQDNCPGGAAVAVVLSQLSAVRDRVRS